jgi:hypothetical protein
MSSDSRGRIWTEQPFGSRSGDGCGWSWTPLILLRIRRPSLGRSISDAAVSFTAVGLRQAHESRRVGGNLLRVRPGSASAAAVNRPSDAVGASWSSLSPQAPRSPSQRRPIPTKKLIPVLQRPLLQRFRSTASRQALRPGHLLSCPSTSYWNLPCDLGNQRS